MNQQHFMTEKARYLARKLHAGDVRADGRAYFHHVDLVAKNTQKILTEQAQWIHSFFHDEIIAAAYMHDLIEDHGNEISLERIEQQFNKNVAAIIGALTKSHETYLEYLLGIKSAKGLIGDAARIIKRADIMANYHDTLYYPSNNKHQMKHLKNKNELAFYILFGEEINKLKIKKT